MAEVKTVQVPRPAGLFSLGSFVASAFFFGLWTFGGSLSSIPLTAAGAFTLSLAFVLQRFGL